VSRGKALYLARNSTEITLLDYKVRAIVFQVEDIPKLKNWKDPLNIIIIIIFITESSEFDRMTEYF
jgi:hypothetical protein